VKGVDLIGGVPFPLPCAGIEPIAQYGIDLFDVQSDDVRVMCLTRFFVEVFEELSDGGVKFSKALETTIAQSTKKSSLYVGGLAVTPDEKG
jgi:hypothetical protein